jgi:hypothetical protein
MIQGNSNTYTVVEQRLDPPLLATKVRIVPFSEHVRTVCMRVELVGCRWHGKYLSLFLYFFLRLSLPCYANSPIYKRVPAY